MFVVMSLGASEEALNAVRSLILDEGLTPHENRGAAGTVIAVLGEGGARLDRLGARLTAMAGVASVTRTNRPFKLTSRAFHPENTVVEVGDVRIGDGSLTIMAGPCAIESREQLLETADAVAAAGADMLRGGAFKPRTSPYSFQGLGLHGLRLLAEARERTGLPVITEVMEPGQVEPVAEYADILQIGARNMQNYSLLMAVGKAGRPVGGPIPARSTMMHAGRSSWSGGSSTAPAIAGRAGVPVARTRTPLAPAPRGRWCVSSRNTRGRVQHRRQRNNCPSGRNTADSNNILS